MPKNPFAGATFDKSRQKWKAQARFAGVLKSLGYYNTQVEAHEAVVQARQQPAELAITRRSIVEGSGSNSPTVAQSNVLIEQPWALTLVEARIFVLFLQQLPRDEIESRRLVVPLKELVGTTPIGGRGYQYLHSALEGLAAVQVTLPVPNRQHDWHRAPLVHSMKLDSGQGTISGYFSPDVLPYLTNLAENFTLGQVADLLSIKSPTTHRFYWLLKSWEFRSPVTVPVARLKELTTGQAYPQYSDYRRNALIPAVAELNELSFEISYKELKLGRSVDKVEFSIKSKARPIPKQLMLPLEKGTAVAVVSELTPLQQKVQTRLQKLKLTQAQTKKVLEIVVGEEQLTKVLKETYPILRDFETRAKPGENVAAATMALLKSTFPAIWAAN
ncbi:RepB family plasmid replication initiator protein [Hymenobacter sp. HMF4947]|uniref:RepB family plasmid replication initiator protein n=1 Tax=Hymenobacter ginkgonis TaxID=2682976 RepID=A0A7K1TLF0_9BACT|nr:replication initiation protein [Hymenobacter ginkgonis]MVN79230.1 RepB family plasmid replication initiator protein [Hymenobacter ginkgonis]